MSGLGIKEGKRVMMLSANSGIEKNQERKVDGPFPNLLTLSDAGLLSAIKTLAAEERRITADVLEHLKEIEKRRLFAALGYSSLFEYCMKELGYSEGSAQRRISAMRLLKEIPEMEEKITSGKLSLSVLSQAQVYFREAVKRNEPMKVEEKKELLKKLELKSSREAERTLFDLSPETVVAKRESTRMLSPTQSEVKFVANEALLKKLEKLRGLLAHRNPHLSTAELIEVLADVALKKLDPATKKLSNDSVAPMPPPTSAVARAVMSRKRYIPAELKRAVWKRDSGCCQFVSEKSGRKCESRFGLEVHHKNPFALGGAHSQENLTLFCRTHNQFEGVQVFGEREITS